MIGVDLSYIIYSVRPETVKLGRGQGMRKIDFDFALRFYRLAPAACRLTAPEYRPLTSYLPNLEP